MMQSALVLMLVTAIQGDDPCRSGPQVKQRPGPYSSLVSVGEERGTLHCYICDAGDRPMVIVFARSLSDPLGKLARGIDKSLKDHQDLRGWITFLAENQTAMDGKIVEWSKQQSSGKVPLSVFEDLVGPPTYLLAREADVTVILAVKQRVAANFAFRAGELNDQAVAEILKAIPRIMSK